MRGPTSAVTINSTTPLVNLYAFGHPRYDNRSSIIRNAPSASKFFRVLLDFCDRCGNFVHVFFIAQQHGLREPNRFPRSFLGYWKFSLQKLVFVFGLLAAQPLAVFAISKHVQLVQRWITCL